MSESPVSRSSHGRSGRFARRAASICALILAAAALTACRSVDPGVFVEYRTATDRVRQGTAEVFRLDYEWTREGYIDRFIADDRAIAELRLHIALAPLEDPACPETGASTQARSSSYAEEARADDTPFRASYDRAPLFARIQAASAAMGALNATVSQYAALLVKLSGEEILDQEKFDRLARELDARANGLAARFSEIGIDAPPAVAQASGLISVAAVEGFRLYVERQRRKALEAALRDNQPLIQGWSCMAKDALGMIGDDISFEYGERFLPLARRFAGARSTADKRGVIEAVLKLNTSVEGTLSSVRSLWYAYGKLPGAHEELAASLRSSKPSFDDLRAFADHASQLSALQQELTKPNTS